MEENRTASVLTLAGTRLSPPPSREPIRVLFLTIDIRIGGAERLVLEIVRHIDRRRFAPSVGWFVDEPAPQEFQELGIPLFPLRKQPGFDAGAMQALARIVREQKIDVINAHHFMSAFYAVHAARIANRAGLVYTEHSEEDVRRARGIWRPIGAALLRWCDGVVGVSDGVSAALASHFWTGASRVMTIENGVDLTRFADETVDRDAARAQLGIARGDFAIGHVANFRRNKNHRFLLEGFRRAFAGRSDVRLFLVGQGFPGDPENSEPDIAAFIRENGLADRVHLLGYRPDVHVLLGALDAFCLVSYKEGLPLSVIEAMAAGLPVIATDIDSLRAVVQHGVSGMLVAPDDVDALATSLSGLAHDSALRHRLGAAGRAMARAKYSFSRCMSQTEHLLSSSAPRQVERQAAGFQA